MDNAPSGLSFIVPAYNEEDGITDTLERLRQVLSTLELETEIILVDDGSTDKTHEIASAIDGICVYSATQSIPATDAVSKLV